MNTIFSSFTLYYVQQGNITCSRNFEQIIREAPEFTDYFFYRTKGGAEVDLLILGPNGKIICIEIKYSLSPIISKGFHQSINDLQPAYSYVITPAGESYQRSDGIRICALSDFLAKELSDIFK